MKLLLLFIPLFLLSCTTSEDIRRDRKIEELDSQLVEAQKLNADMTLKLQEYEEQFKRMMGKIEEVDHSSSQTRNELGKTFSERMKILEEANEVNLKNVSKLQTDINSLNKKINDQDNYIKKVLSSLNKLSKSGNSKKAQKKTKKLNNYDQAMADYKSRKYTAAKPQLEKLLEDKKIKGNKKARVIHNLGMVSYIKKNYTDSLTYFSRLYSEYPKAPYCANGLLYLAKSFLNLKRSDDAKQALNELIAKYPKSRSIKEAKRVLKGIK